MDENGNVVEPSHHPEQLVSDDKAIEGTKTCLQLALCSVPIHRNPGFIETRFDRVSVS
jgi:hypothetical protein